MMRLMLTLMMALLVSPQENDGENFKELYDETLVQLELAETERAGLEAQLHMMGRPYAKCMLESLLLQRLITPIDKWMEAPQRSNEPLPPDHDHHDRWYVLKIATENEVRNPPIYIRFYINGLDCFGYNNRWRDYLKIKRTGILDTLERYLTLNMSEDVTMEETIIYGQPHFYRIATRNSDVEKVTEKDLIY